MLMEPPPGTRSSTAKEQLKAEAGHQQAAAPLPPNKSVLIVSTSARLGINRHSAYQHSYQHAANQEHCTRTCTWLSIFNVVIKVAQSCVAVNICNTQGSRITHTHTHTQPPPAHCVPECVIVFKRIAARDPALIRDMAPVLGTRWGPLASVISLEVQTGCQQRQCPVTE